MRKNNIFLRTFAMLCFLIVGAMYVNASTVNDLKTINSTQVFAFGDYVSDGTGSRTAGALFGGGFFLDVKGGSVAKNKGSIDIATTSTYTAVNDADVEYLSSTYTSYGSRANCLRFKNASDLIALKPIAGSTIYLFGNGNNQSGTKARIPKFATDASLTVVLNEAPDADFPSTSNYVYMFEVPSDFDGNTPLYIGSYNGDVFFSFIIVECPELFKVTTNSIPAAGGSASIISRTASEDNTSEEITVKAEPNENYAFKEWQDAEGNVLSTDVEYTFTATKATEINAFFYVSYSETSPATKVDKNIPIAGESYTIDATYNAGGSLGTAYGNMLSQGGVKLRTGQTGNTIRFDVNPGWKITGITLSMYANDAGTIDVVSASVDGNAVADFTTVTLPSNTAKEAKDITLKNISAQTSIVFGFDNTNKVDNNQVFVTYVISYDKAGVHNIDATCSPVAGGTVVLDQNTKADGLTDEVILTATANEHYTFKEWQDANGTQLSTANPYTFETTADKEVVAIFVEDAKYSVTYELGEGVEGQAPATVTDYEGGTATIPANFTVYKEGHTLTGWTDGSNNYVTNDVITIGTSDITLTPVFTTNEVSLADRTEAVTLKWDFQRQNGAPTVGWQGTSGHVWVTQATVKGKVIDVKCDIDVTNGKIANANWTDWAQMNGGTKVSIPSCKDAVVSMEAYSAPTTTTIDGQTDYTANGNTISYTVANTAEAINVVIGDGGYYRYIQTVLPFVDDDKAPAVVGSVPGAGVTNASANGRVVINFDERIKRTDAAKATLNGEELALTVSGKTITAEYKGLSYATAYTFRLAAGSVSDLADNVLEEDVTLEFTTMDKAVVTKALYDFIVPDDGNFKEALEAAAARDDMNKRYRIFVKRGAYIIPADESAQVTGHDGNNYADPRTYFNTPNVSIIGEDMDETSIANYLSNESYEGDYGPTHPLEGIRTSGLLYLQSGATNTYFEDITLKTNTPDATGRNVVLVDGGNKTICKDVCLWAYQDTYKSDNKNNLYYFEGGVIRGRTDFICGSGDVFFNGVDIIMCEKGGFIVAPQANVKYGYVFKGCTIKGGTNAVNGNYYLGRPWSEDAETYYIDCVMEAIPTAEGWTNMSDGGCTRFAEYNSMTASGASVDLSDRVKELGTETVNPNNPVLTAEEAAEIGDMTNMFGDWNPTLATEQASAPTNVKIDDKVITWDNNDYVLLWAICKDGKVIGFTTEPTYTVEDATATYSVRAANEMGGLGEATEAVAAKVLVINDTETECADFNPIYEKYDRVVYNRELNTGYTYGLICLPFVPDAESLNNFQFYTLSSVDEDAVTFVEEDNLEAGKPYLYSIKEGATRTSTITGGESEYDLNDKTAVSNTTVGTWTLVGSLKNETINCTADATINNYIFNPLNNTLHKVTKTLTIYPYTAYLRNNVASTLNNLSQMRVFIGTPTGIKEISRDQIEGFGEKAGMFDLQGRAMSNPVKGQIYIENGEKKIKK